MDKLISIDTNVIVRFLTEDDQQQFEKAKDLIKKNSIFVPTTVVLETDWVLRFAYKFKNENISKAFSRFFGLPNVIAENAKVLENAIAWSQAGLEFADALHLAASQETQSFASFDQQLCKRGSSFSACPLRDLN